ncbi:MAG: hypothetical protein U1G07_13380 [Verrucomicrobiota bacterium]
MRNYIIGKLFTFMTAALALAALSAGSEFTSVYAKGGNGGGNKVVESRVTGYVTSIDYDNGTIQIGASYYGSGNLLVTSDTSITSDNTSCSLEDLELGDWVEARYVRVLDPSSGLYLSVATRLSAVTVPSP